MVMESKEFALRVISNSEKYAERLRREVLDSMTSVDRETLIEMYRWHIWTEFVLGVLPPAKMLVGIPDEHLDIKYRLGEQIEEEQLHSRVFSGFVKEMGGDPEITHYQPTKGQLKLWKDTYDFDDFLDISASMQVTGEVVLIHILRRLARLSPPSMGKILEDQVIKHEGKHVVNGRMILERFATTEEKQRRVVEVSERKFEALCEAYGVKFYGLIKTVQDA